jgi:hypothetical protein
MIKSPRLDLGFKMSARNVDCICKRTFVIFVWLTNVED